MEKLDLAIVFFFNQRFKKMNDLNLWNFCDIIQISMSPCKPLNGVTELVNIRQCITMCLS